MRADRKGGDFGAQSVPWLKTGSNPGFEASVDLHKFSTMGSAGVHTEFSGSFWAFSPP